MTAFVANVTFDCDDPYALAEFWSKVTGRPIAEEDKPGDEVVDVALDGDLNLVFIKVPEPKTVKNRVHVCLRPDGTTRDVELNHLLELGAKIVANHREPDGTSWTVFVDPEGNEFCLLRGLGQ